MPKQPQRAKRLTPQTARTTKEILKLKRDNVDAGEYSMLVEEKAIHLYGSGNGEINRMSIPKEDFDVLVDMYING